MAKRPAPPVNWGPAGVELWKEIAWKYELRPDEIKILKDACEAADIQELLKSDIHSTTLKTQGSQGQDVINPSLPEWRQYSNLVAGHLGKLKLPDEAPGIKGAVTTKQQSPAVAHKTRAEARAKWGIAQ